ncbi:hypothetical protein DEU37_1842 [Microbacterium sp. AG790]|uniref:hypothetical protein n=1 Tax=Microbacterium sp. AG790 TaxID=2183995 RepID=UPI000EAF68D7|nr:hypothetical protein [Microbacterium sp. AG790]RKS89526.1 hypothetical protein DEU37_1842 [Microbacterium sp. AG790]
MRVDPLHLVDVLIYLVILNLTAQFIPSVIAESFVVSLATAIMLKLVLEGVLRVKKAVVARLRAASTGARRVTSIVMLVLILPGSKFVVLWLEDLLFGDAVSLGGFWSVTLLVLALTAARAGVRRAIAPGRPTT